MDVKEIQIALDSLCQQRKESGIVVLNNNGGISIGDQQCVFHASKTSITRAQEKLTDATVEVLAIIAYRQPISKAEVKPFGSQFPIFFAQHSMRGLIEKVVIRMPEASYTRPPPNS